MCVKMIPIPAKSDGTMGTLCLYIDRVPRNKKPENIIANGIKKNLGYIMVITTDINKPVVSKLGIR